MAEKSTIAKNDARRAVVDFEDTATLRLFLSEHGAMALLPHSVW
jgi:ribosomal protein S18